jgi:hypothetical protein
MMVGQGDLQEVACAHAGLVQRSSAAESWYQHETAASHLMPIASEPGATVHARVLAIAENEKAFVKPSIPRFSSSLIDK